MSKKSELTLTAVTVEKPVQSEVQVKVENNRSVKGNKGRNGKMASETENEFVYVNSAFVGSVNNVNENRRPTRTPAEPAAPITEVYREQYWACSRWPYTQRVLAIAVGILLGALIGLTISLLLRDENDSSVIGPIFTRQHIAPD